MKSHLLEIIKEGKIISLKVNNQEGVKKVTTNYIVSSLIEEDEVDYKSINTFAKKPYINEIICIFQKWIKDGNFPYKFKKLHLLNDDLDYYKKLNELTPLLQTYEKSQKKEDLELFIKGLGLRGLLTCLRVRKTQGSVNYFPPSTAQLIKSFNSPYKKEPKISSGAVALAKHCVRNKEDEFYGGILLKGNQKQKTEKAESVLIKILENVEWINIHLLPHKIPCFEIRVEKGYGARWVFRDYKDGAIVSNEVTFRGFLEPQMEDGHEKKWIH